QANGIMTATVALPQTTFSESAKRAVFYRGVLDRLSNLPGVSMAAAGMPVPFSGMGGSASFNIEGRPTPPGDPGPHGDIGFVSPSYFTALKIPLQSGRLFTEQDREGTEPVVIIDETLARQYWPNESAIGKHMGRGRRASWSTIVGIVGHTKQGDLAGD